MLGERRAQCPNCGGPIEIGLASSSALVCPHCRYSVIRTDRDLQAVGRVADLVPTAPPIAVGDSGRMQGRGFRVAGRLQLDHGRGPWDEWYIGFDDGSWGWLARAQGRFYFTQPSDPSGVPPFEQMGPGQAGHLPGAGPSPVTVAERGHSQLLSAEGELPFPIVPGQQGRYVDISGPDGVFGTIDYGDGSRAPMLFVGRVLAPNELDVHRIAGGPRPEEQVSAGKLECPNCGAPVSIVTPESTERAACGYCYALLDVRQGNLSLLHQLSQPQLIPLVPLGSRGTLKGEERVVIGFMQRDTVVEGVTYAWREYLLYGPSGYAWLMEDEGHWLLVSDVPAGDVDHRAARPVYKGRSYRPFSRNSATVKFVVGEFYWRVEVGETTQVADHVAPPRILSWERSDDELHWSEGEYVEGKEVWKAFRLHGGPPKPRGVAPAQPNPHRLLPGMVAFGVLMAAFFVLFLIDVGSPRRVLVDGPLPLPAMPGEPPAQTAVDRAVYTPPFTVDKGPTTLGVLLSTNADNQYVGVGCALIDEDSGDVREFWVDAGYYHGVSGGERWTEGSRNDTVYLDRVPAGRYTLRLDPQWQNYPARIGRSPPSASVQVRQGDRSLVCCTLTFFLIFLPLPAFIFRQLSFERRRWYNSNLNG